MLINVEASPGWGRASQDLRTGSAGSNRAMMVTPQEGVPCMSLPA